MVTVRVLHSSREDGKEQARITSRVFRIVLLFLSRSPANAAWTLHLRELVPVFEVEQQTRRQLRSQRLIGVVWPHQPSLSNPLRWYVPPPLSLSRPLPSLPFLPFRFLFFRCYAPLGPSLIFRFLQCKQTLTVAFLSPSSILTSRCSATLALVLSLSGRDSLSFLPELTPSGRLPPRSLHWSVLSLSATRLRSPSCSQSPDSHLLTRQNGYEGSARLLRILQLLPPPVLYHRHRLLASMAQEESLAEHGLQRC